MANITKINKIKIEQLTRWLVSKTHVHTTYNKFSCKTNPVQIGLEFFFFLMVESRTLKVLLVCLFGESTSIFRQDSFRTPRKRSSVERHVARRYSSRFWENAEFLFGNVFHHTRLVIKRKKKQLRKPKTENCMVIVETCD